MGYILDKYVSPCVLMTLGFSLSRLAARGQWAGRTSSEASARRKLVLRLVELVNQSEERNCDDVRVITMMCIAKMVGAWCSRAFSPSYRQVRRRSVISRVILFVRIWLSCLRLVLSIAGYR
jgi:hypothetical protein